MKFVTKTLLTGSLLASSALVIAGDATPPSPITGSLALTSDYIFRGLSQTQEKPAIQGGLTYTHANGFHAGLWGSNIDFKSKDNPSAYEDGANMEVDIGMGYGGKISDTVTWDVSATYYSYPGSNVNGTSKYGFWEILPTLVYDFGSAKVTGSLAYSPDFFGNAKSGTYLMAALDVPLPADFALNAHIGEQWLKADKNSGLPQTFVDITTTPGYIPKNYSEWKLGISKQIAGVGLELAYFDTSLNKDKCLAFQGQKDLCGGRAVLTVSKTF
ncbi:conserved exported hypothetical protein [Gammaproteobacteria bacterium]